MCTLFRKKEIKNTNEIINTIDRLKRSRKPEIYQYYYAFMLELKNGGFSLVNVGHADFFPKIGVSCTKNINVFNFKYMIGF